MKDEPTLNAYLQVLTPEEKRILCWVLNQVATLDDSANVHVGMLPFIRVEKARKVLKAWGGTHGKFSRKLAQIAAKLGSNHSHLAPHLYLCDAKVHKRFGAHPERGKPIPLPTYKTVEADTTRSNLPYKQMFGKVVKDKLLVKAVIALTRLPAYEITRGVKMRTKTHSMWRVSVDPNYRDQAVLWLGEYCS